jgi:hypothetical protein
MLIKLFCWCVEENIILILFTSIKHLRIMQPVTKASKNLALDSLDNKVKNKLKTTSAYIESTNLVGHQKKYSSHDTVPLNCCRV